MISEKSRSVTNIALESARCVTQSERHDQIFKPTILAVESGKPFMAFFIWILLKAWITSNLVYLTAQAKFPSVSDINGIEYQFFTVTVFSAL